jgi:hypothetical protein
MKPKLQSPKILKVSTQLQGLDTVSFLAYHRVAHNGQPDRISQHVEDFKNGVEPQTSRWVSLAAELAGNSGEYDVIIRSLGSDELSRQTGSPLDRLCEEIAKKGNSRYQPARLSKKRITRKLQGLGGKAGHMKELHDSFEFVGDGLKSDARILVVDDMLATGATLETIALAVNEALPRSHVSGFVLSRAGGPNAVNSIEPDFFTSPEGASAPAAVKVAPAKPDALRARTKGVAEAPPVRGKHVPTKPVSRSTNRRTVSIGAAFGIILAFAAVGAILPLRSGAKEPPREVRIEALMLPPAETTSVSTRIEDPVPAPPAVIKPKYLHPAIVTMPSAGLRANHSVDARSLHKATVHEGEKVEILKRFSANSGPDWLQLRTRSGDVGWVMASVVKELK